MDSLLLFSGGLDSVQVFAQRCMEGKETRLHHVQLKSWNRRHPYEKAAVNSALSWARRNGYGSLFKYTESSFDYGDLKYIVRDHNVWSLFAGIILQDPKNAGITKVLRTFHRDSVIGGLESPAGQAAEIAWRGTVERVARRELEFEYPQLHMTKAEIIAAMPPELVKACWYCRTPQGGRPCHKCHTCKAVDAALAGKPWIPLDERGGAVGDPAPGGADGSAR